MQTLVGVCGMPAQAAATYWYGHASVFTSCGAIHGPHTATQVAPWHLLRRGAVASCGL